MLRLSKCLFLLAIGAANAANVPADDTTIKSMTDAAVDLAIETQGKEYAQFQLDIVEGGRGLQADGREQGQLCGENNECAEGNECARVAIGRRCKPVSCIGAAIAALEEEWDRDAYQSTILAATNLTVDEIVEGSQKMATPFGLRSNGIVQKIADAMRANPPPHARMNELAKGCYTTSERASEPGSTSTYGFWLEVGALLDFGFEVMSAQGEADETAAILVKYCGGGEAGGGGELAFAYGFHCEYSVYFDCCF